MTAIALTKDQRFVSGSSDRSVKMWSLKDYKMENKLNMVHSSKVAALAVSKDGEIIISGSSNGSMKIIKFKWYFVNRIYRIIWVLKLCCIW